MDSVRVGMIGFGLAGRFFHAPLILSTEGYDVRTVCSTRTEDVKEVLPKARIVTSVSDIINDPNIDLVINCAPNAFHYLYSAAALEQRKHVVVEKPFINDVAEGLNPPVSGKMSCELNPELGARFWI